MFDPSANVRADAKLKQLVIADEQAADDLWEFRNPEPEGKVLPFSEIRAEIPLRWGFTISHARLLEFYRWFALKRQYDQAAATAAQAREELSNNPEISDEELDRYTARVFKGACANSGNVDGFVALKKLELAEQKLAQDARRISLLEAKAKQADAAKGISDNAALTPEEKAARLKQIFGMG